MAALNKIPFRRAFVLSIVLPLALSVAGCAAPPSDPAIAATTPATVEAPRSAASVPAATVPVEVAARAAPAPVTRNKPAPPMSDPLPAQPLPAANPAKSAGVPTLDLSCKSSADCAVKNVGNCCGMQPRCVNVNARVDAKAVQEQCARTGMASVCGFKAVESCECVKGQCEDKPMMFEAQ